MVFVRRSAFLDDVEVTDRATVLVMEDVSGNLSHPIGESLRYGKGGRIGCVVDRSSKSDLIFWDLF